MQTLKRLKSEIKKNGFIYKLVERTEHKLIYAQTKGNEIFGYEVFKNKISKIPPLWMKPEENFEETESFPGDEEFGKRAWYYQSFKQANEKYQSIPHENKEIPQIQSEAC